jgi:transcription elongation factor GreB
MSRAIRRDPGGEPSEERDEQERPEARLPAGTKNYITPGGLRRLQDELHELRYVERPEVTATVAWAAENGDRSENADYKYGKRRLHQIDRRLRFLAKRIRAAEVVDPAEREDDRAFFGATVTVRDEDDQLKTYAIVGVDEGDASRNRISWVSPLARALRGKQEGDVVTFRAPGGLRELEVEAVEYLPLE